MSRHLPFVLVGFMCLACSPAPEPTPTTPTTPPTPTPTPTPTPPPIDYSHAADFTYSGTLQPRQPITFTTSSSTAQSYSWDFGDVTAPVTGKQPVHTFTRAGTFPVKLTAATAGGTIVSTQQLTISRPDTLGPYFAAITGEYRFTQKKEVSWPGSNTGSTACDILVTASGANNQLVLKQQNGSNFGYSDMELLPVNTSRNYYIFSYSGYHERRYVSFKIGGDSILYYSGYFGSVGSTETYYWGKRR